MEFRRFIILSLQIMNVIPKRYKSSSEESIENLLYFKDCQKKNEASSTHPPFEKLVAPPRPKPMDCPFPKMCCSITCNVNECNSPALAPYMPPDAMGAEQVFPPIMPLSEHHQPIQSQIPRGRKKKVKQPMRLQIPAMMNGRRDSGVTKDRIKSLINQDDDIKKILKDLVRVTMQKVDLVDMTRRQGLSIPAKLNPNTSPPQYEEDDDDDDELE